MKKLAIVSSFNESCGNAAFTKILQDSISLYTGHMVEVMPLDLPLLQSIIGKERKLANRHIEQISNRLKEFDAVNIQLEPGLYGTIPADIVNRVTTLVKANAKTSVTLHSPRLLSQSQSDMRQGIKKILTCKVISGLKMLFSAIYPSLHVNMNRKILKTLVKNKCRLIVHTLRAKRQIKNMYDYDCVDVHPLKMVEEHKRTDLKFLSEIKKAFNFDDNDIIVGMFGYLSRYKGHLEALSAMRHLPTQYKLVIFGRQHPQTLQKEQVDPYINLLTLKVCKSPSLRDRVFFMGELEDKDFIEAASSVDIVWLPYYENGQDGSGIASICCDVSKRVLASSSFAFDELMKLIPYKNVMRFDIGNYLEMANKTQLMLSCDIAKFEFDPNSMYSLKTQAMLYIKDV